MDDGPLLIGVVLLFLFAGKKKASAATTSTSTSKPAATPDADGAALMKRANQAAAQAWVATFMNEGVPSDEAEAMARWAGIESSGNPTAVSSIGERGLLQLGAAMHSDGALDDADWAALISPATTRAEHAKIAMQLVDWIYTRARKLVTNPPDHDNIAMLWLAKLYHQRPVDVRDAKMNWVGTPQSMAEQLAEKWAGDAKAMHRLRAANVVAFGTPSP